MRNQENDFSICRFFAQAGEDSVLRIGIQSACGFIKDENTFVGKESTGQGNALLLTAGEVASIFQNQRRVAVLTGIYEGRGIGKPGGS